MMLMKRTHALSGAPITMRKLGKSTDATILKKIIGCPGITVSTIAEVLKWSNGRVDGSINRLILGDLVEVKHLLQRGMLVKKIYPKDYSAKPQNIVEIPKEMMDTPLGKFMFVYALSRSTIGMSPEENEEWDGSALSREKVNISKEHNSISITLSERLSNFYQLENSEKSLSTVGNIAMVTVETVLPVRLPATYPEEIKNASSFYRLEVERERLESVSTDGRFVYTRDKKTIETENYSCSSYLKAIEFVQDIITVANSCTISLKEPIVIPVVSK